MKSSTASGSSNSVSGDNRDEATDCLDLSTLSSSTKITGTEASPEEDSLFCWEVSISWEGGLQKMYKTNITKPIAPAKCALILVWHKYVKIHKHLELLLLPQKNM